MIVFCHINMQVINIHANSRALMVSVKDGASVVVLYLSSLCLCPLRKHPHVLCRDL